MKRFDAAPEITLAKITARMPSQESVYVRVYFDREMPFSVFEDLMLSFHSAAWEYAGERSLTDEEWKDYTALD